MSRTNRYRNPRGGAARWLAALAGLLLAAALPALLARFSPTAQRPAPPDPDDYARELRSYVTGGTLALVLTAIPFALVHWSLLPHVWLLATVGTFAFVQVAVHFRYFLHIDPPRQNNDDLLLILFSALILAAMAGGTIWILGDLATRMS